MRLNRAGYTDRAEQEGNKTDQIQEAIEIIECLAQIFLALLDGLELETKAAQLRNDFGDGRVHVRAGREFHEVEITRDTARLKQMRVGQILQRNINARRKAGRGRSFAGH